MGYAWNEGPARFGERVGRQDCSQVWGVTPFYAWQPARATQLMSGPPAEELV